MGVRFAAFAGFVLAALTFMSAQAADPAGFLDCTSPDSEFAQKVDAEGTWTCAESGRKFIDAGKGYDVATRVVHAYYVKKSLFAKTTPKILATVEKSLKLWRAAVPDMGLPGRISIVLLDDLTNADLGVKEHGVTQQLSGHECLVVVNVSGITKDYTQGLKKPASPSAKYPHEALLPEDPLGDFDPWYVAPNEKEIPRHIQKVVAHEVAHCVQQWYAPDSEKLASFGGAWWVEGSAEMLASLAVPRAVATLERYKLFDLRSAETPLTEMTYEALTFFQWLWNQSPPRVFALMKAMPTDQEGYAPQAAALKAFLKPEEFDAFARAYIDQEIEDVTGELISAPVFQDPKVVEGQLDDLKIHAKPLTIFREQIAFTGGDYEIEAQGAPEPLSWRLAAGGGWAKPLAADVISPDCKAIVSWTVAAMPLTAEKAGARYLFKRTKKCESCINTKIHDACMIGDWQISKEGLAILLDKWNGGDPSPTVGGEGGAIRFSGGGGGEVAIEDLQVFTKTSKDNVLLSGWVGASGSDRIIWSTKGEKAGILYMCPTVQGVEIGTMITASDLKSGKIISEPKYTPIATGLMEPSQFDFTCSGDIATLTYTGPVDLGERRPKWTLTRTKASSNN